MRTKYNPATAQTYYLNSTGTRCVSIDRDGNRETLPVSLDGVTIKIRSIRYWEQCGNFAFPVIRVKGKETIVYPDSEVTPEKWLPFYVKYPNA